MYLTRFSMCDRLTPLCNYLIDQRKEAFRELLYVKKGDFVDFRKGPLPVSVAPEVKYALYI